MANSDNIALYDLHTRIRSPIICSMMDVTAEDRVLDVGSGTGYFAEKMRSSGATTVCLDSAFENLLSITQRQKKHLLLINAQAEHLPLRNESFDKILCSEVLEHIAVDRGVLKELVRILRPGGILVITVPCTEYRFPSVINFLGIKTVHDHEGPEKHYRKGYTRTELSAALHQAGMTVSRFVYFSHFFSQLLLDMISIMHILIRKLVMRQKSWNWADIQELNSSSTFTLYKLLFPVFLVFSKIDKLFFLSTKARGSGLAIRSAKLVTPE
ncbi:MAG: methyltransferase domain-containing protein [Proteobacteria bacterium]|nr:methyltransferase domain-containing protein [Pseudomonadota bacterium]